MAPLTSTTKVSTATATTTTTAGPPPDEFEVFGYQSGDSVALNTQSGQVCDIYGFYETPTLAELQSGISVNYDTLI